MKLRFFIFVMAALFLSGCNGSESESVNESVRIVASEKNLPENFHEIAFTREAAPHYSYFARHAGDNATYEETWELFNLNGKMPEIDFSKHHVIFIGVEESGSCPYELKADDVSINEQMLTVNLPSPDGPCTADATARTFVIQITKEQSNQLKELTIVENSPETTLPLK